VIILQPIEFIVFLFVTVVAGINILALSKDILTKSSRLLSKKLANQLRVHPLLAGYHKVQPLSGDRPKGQSPVINNLLCKLH
jgi:hypothetical protein